MFNFSIKIRSTLFSLFFLFFTADNIIIAQQVKIDKHKLIKIIDSNISDGASQYKVMMRNLPHDKFPKTFDAATNTLQTCNSDWWVSGFYPGTLLLLFEQTKDSALYREALRIMKTLEKEKYNTTTHDLGFMMFCSFGNAYRLNPTIENRNILITSANSLASRFNPNVGCIKSWDAGPEEFLVIVDNMMNLELLFWATKATGDSSYYKIAVTHADSTMKHHYRPDHSSYHVLNYNSKTGKVLQKKTAQGYSDESAWARGQAWGLYGYTVMFRETRNAKYLDQAQNIAEYLLSHDNLPQDKIPYWDFNAPNIPQALRDVSAGCIMAAALMELSKFSSATEAAQYVQCTEKIIASLSMSIYKSAPGSNGGFMLKHSVGNMPEKTEIDVPLTYADYYFTEAMIRYKHWNKVKK